MWTVAAKEHIGRYLNNTNNAKALYKVRFT